MSRRIITRCALVTVASAAFSIGLGCGPGDEDPSGSAGTSGGAGTTGAAGTTGSAGTTGNAGTTGSAGTSGAAGTTGVAGTTGNAGTIGNAGTTGVAGTTGAGGTTGVAGTTGSAGITGNAGRGGTTGNAGTTGSAGRGGTTGNAGTTGSGGTTAPGASGLPVPPGANTMPKPSGAVSTMTVVNWAGFKGAVSYSFDDSNSSQINNYSQMKALGVPFTFFMWTGKSEASNSIWMTAKNDGHEIANHTQSHSSNGTGADIDAATQFIMTKFGVRAWTMAAPNGAAVYTGLANGRFMINRGVSDKVIAPNDNSDPFTLPTYIPPTGASTSAFNGEVDSARTAGGWRTMCIHGFSGGSDSAYQPVPLDQWVASVNHAKQLGDMWIDTISAVGAYWRGQKAFSSATTMMSGSDKTWKWTLPTNFPPGKYLRVTVSGGTVKQNGVELPWDGHGYYEIALDAGQVTVSP